MFVHVVAKKGGPSYVYLKETHRTSSGLTKSVTVQSFGRLDKLLAEDPLALEKLKAKYNGTGNSSDERRAGIEETARRILEGREGGAGLVALPAVSYAMMPLLRIWNDDFRLGYCLDYIRRHDTKIEFDVASYAAFLCFLKVVDPASINSSFDDALTYAGDFLRGAKLDELYRTYDFLSDWKDKIMAFVNKRLDDVVRKGRKASMVFYDVTNAYFETMFTDEERGLARPGAAQAAAEAIGAADPGRIPDEALIWGGDGKCKGIDFSMLPPELKQALRASSYLRMRGPSKEHRADLPIVSIAMAIDEWGMPIDFQIYSGASSESRTMAHSIEEMKRKYCITDQIVVADRGLNSADNLAMLLSNGCGFLVAQKVTNLDRETRGVMLSDEGWTWHRERNGEEPDLRYKIIQDYEKASAATGEKVRCTLVLTWSRKRARHEEARLHFEESLGKHFDDGSYAKRKELCGYSAILYGTAPGKGRALNGDEIVKAWSMLERTERELNASKSNFSLRPMRASTESDIKGHVLLCVLALMLSRNLQDRLARAGIHMKAERISEVLRSARFTPLSQNGSDLSDNHLTYTRNDERCCKTDLDNLIEACGLAPLPSLFDRATFSKCMGRRFSKDEDLIGRSAEDNLV